MEPKDLKKENPLSLEQKEIVLIFCLFIFAALLMFTVGILVGKGITQSKYDRKFLQEKLDPSLEEKEVAVDQGQGTIVNSGILERAEEKKAEHESLVAKKEDSLEEKNDVPVQWIPQKKETNLHSSHDNLLEPQKIPTDEILKNPHLKSVIEDAGPREPASIPKSFATGKFTVQIASYPTQKDAQNRVETLKKLGFSNAYFSVNEMEHTKETWYRVWIGFFSEFKEANEAGKFLKDRGEVKQYLVRKTDNAGKED